MDKREQLIVNYFIILQLHKFKRDESISFFHKYRVVLEKRFVNCIFDFQGKDKNLLSSYNPDMEKNAKSVLDENQNGNILFFEDDDYPDKFKTIDSFPIILFYKGNIKLLQKKSISVVGTRKPTEKAIFDTKRITKYLVYNNLVIVSGLAKGVDVIAHGTAYTMDYNDLVGVIGTTINKYYPVENKNIQRYVANNGLLLTEYASFESTFKWNFLRRNFVMSVISDATIVVEAGDTSGTISQARSTLKNSRPLFVPHSVFIDPNNSWPQKFRNDFNLIQEFSSFDDLSILLNKFLKRGK